MSDRFSIEFDERSLEEPRGPVTEVETDGRTIVLPEPEPGFRSSDELCAGERLSEPLREEM